LSYSPLPLLTVNCALKTTMDFYSSILAFTFVKKSLESSAETKWFCRITGVDNEKYYD
jgi:hypothetical protein